jgi:single-stranded DNA-binding protein
MSTFILISGVVFRAPVQKISKAGKPFTSCTVKVGSDDAGSGDFWSVLIFSESAQLEMLRLEAGDAVSVRGKLKLELYTANDGQTKISRTIFADAVLGLRPTPRTPKAKAASAPSTHDQSTTTTATDPGLDDSIPF